ncbi:MAG: hypothetical protein HYX68_27040 [Planctomycetes bacterium]|nr:hypothetical protein [Planctomycetota bacterium]
MIRIKPEMLQLAGRLADVRREALKTDGVKNWSRHHLISYEGGGYLTFMTSDNRIGVVSRLPVEGVDSPWSATIVARPFDHIAKYVNGGAYELDPCDAKVIVLRKVPFKYPLRRGEPGGPFPLLTAPPADEGSASFDPAVVERALSLLMDSNKKRDDEGGLDFCSLFEDGLIAYSDGGVLWKARGPVLPSAIHLRRGDAFRAWEWLKALEAAEVTTTMHIAAVEKDGRWSIVFWSHDRAHLLQVRSAPRSFPRRAVDGPEYEVPTVCCDVDRDTLRRRAGMSCQAPSWKLDCEFATLEDGNHVFKARFDVAGKSGGRDQLEIENWQQAEEAQQLNSRFTVGSRNLERLLHRLTSSRVKIAFHQRAHCLSVTPVPDDGNDLDAGAVVGFLRTGVPEQDQDRTTAAPADAIDTKLPSAGETGTLEALPGPAPTQIS